MGHGLRRLHVPLMCLAMAGCAPQLVSVQVPAAAPVQGGEGLRAGFAIADITPAPGFPIFGFATAGEPRARGYRMRLQARALVLERGPGRVAIVQVDLGAASAWLRREVAARIAPLGISLDRLLLAATHTHGGPGGYLESRFYNEFGAGRPGHDRELIAFLADRIAQAIARATQQLTPAALSTTRVEVLGLTHNRSPEALDPASPPTPSACEGHSDGRVDRCMRMLYVHDVTHDRPLGAVAVFAVHGTSVGLANGVYHGDLQGVFTRHVDAYFRDHERAATAGPGFVTLILNGAEGDVSPSLDAHGDAAMLSLGTRLGELAIGALSPLALPGAPRSRAPVLQVAYREPSVARLCPPLVGAATLAGAEDGRSPLYPRLAREPMRLTKPDGCQGRKPPAFGRALQAAILSTSTSDGHRVSAFPERMPLQLVRVGDLLFAGVPGEPTTSIGRAIAAWVHRVLGGEVAVVSHANAYVGYVTNEAEFDAQHYEGASTLYGPEEGRFVVRNLWELARSLRDGPTGTHSWPATVTFAVGQHAGLLPRRGPCHSELWRLQGMHVERGQRTVELRWKGWSSLLHCPWPPVGVHVECGPEAALQADDGGTEFLVERRGADRWRAVWFPPRAAAGKSCSMTVERPVGEPLRSEHFVAP